MVIQKLKRGPFLMLSRGRLPSTPQHTPYADRMTRLSLRIFGELPRSGHSNYVGVEKAFARRPFEDDERSNSRYYPPHPQLHQLGRMLRMHGVYRDEHKDFQDEMWRQREKRGKYVPKPGNSKKEWRAARAAMGFITS